MCFLLLSAHSCIYIYSAALFQHILGYISILMPSPSTFLGIFLFCHPLLTHTWIYLFYRPLPAHSWIYLYPAAFFKQILGYIYSLLFKEHVLQMGAKKPCGRVESLQHIFKGPATCPTQLHNFHCRI